MEETREKDRIGAVNIVFLITILVSVVMSFLPLGFLDAYPAVQIVISQLILAVPVAVYMAKERMSYRETVQLNPVKLMDLLLVLVFGVLLQPVLTLINAISMVFSTNSTNTFLFEFSQTMPLPVMLLLVAVLPCVCEESVYRGFFYQQYKKAHPWKAVLLSGFLFGLMHGNLNQFCYATVMGIVFALLIEATGSILSTMLIHFAINGFSVVMMYLYPLLYDALKMFYQMATESGDTATADMITSSMGDMTLSGTEWMEQTMNMAVELKLADVLYVYLLPAVGSGVLAYWVFRTIAIRTGRWEHVRALFGKREGTRPLVTIPLMVAIAVGVVFMFFVELLMRLPR
ncbi:MAG: CPBP family intramembrane metalloprotease [Lachnospiraceae bacterium]|nr:CPBP family intramembrane metalloprotease [Lachnospiraceae bacterium]